MIVIKSPFRVSFFGGGSDFPEWFFKEKGSVLTSTIDKFVYLLFNNKIKTNFNYEINYSIYEKENLSKRIKHPAFRKFINFYNLKNLNVTFMSDLPAFAGLASSSALAVSLINYYYSYIKKQKINQKLLADKSIFFEREVLKEKVGFQDQIAISYGGINEISFSKNNYKCNSLKIDKNIINKLNNNLILLDTGQKRFSSFVQKKLIKNFEKSKKLNSALHEMVEISLIGKKYLTDGNFNMFTELFKKYWELKIKSNPYSTNEHINYIYDMALDYGATCGKLLGAGSGGFFLFIVPQNKKKDFLKITKYFKCYDYNLTFEGSKYYEI